MRSLPKPRQLARAYRLRWERRRHRARAIRRSLALKTVVRRTGDIADDAILLVAVLRNERVRLPHFLKYYRRLGVGHFLIVDNGSVDGTGDYLEAQRDVSLWRTETSYRRAAYGMDWANYLLNRYGAGHWCLTVDGDEFLVYPHCDTRPLNALTDWLDDRNLRSFGTLLLDMYSERPFEQNTYREGADPFRKLRYFDAGNYTIRRNGKYGNLWIQGGPRQRLFFDDMPDAAPALNKIPLVKWQRGFVYTSSTHSLLPRSLNIVYDDTGGERACGCILHAKFLNILRDKTLEELERQEHYAAGREFRAYGKVLGAGRSLWTEQSVKYRNWHQLEDLGLMSSGGWM